AIQGEPFQENGRMYVNVLAPKGIKKVRWYTETEYRRMYPNITIEHSETEFNARKAFGFGEKGYISIYKGKNVEEWAEKDRTNIWFNLIFGYYTPSKFKPVKTPNEIEVIQLKWEDIMAHNNQMKPYDEVQKLMATILGNESTSTFQGEINDWLEKTIVVVEKKTKDSHFGVKHTYTLEDNESNVYVWETGAKDYTPSTTIALKMKVKEHKEINGIKTTIVWYCKEV
ncbi:MAG: hypothetical protein LIR46_00265, partial [Bacteroidota bacterium]|nr:hypothetical protein [Bacteroidota bacterium]